MNTAFINIIKRIVAEQGEAILDDPGRLKGFVRDYAKNEPKEDRVAFGRCIEAGAYAGLKNVHTQEERRQVKAAFLPHIQAASGLSAGQCRDALDTLEAVLFGTPQPAPQRPARQSPAPGQPGAAPQIYQMPVPAPGYQPAAYTPAPAYAPVPAKSHAPRNALIAVLVLALIAALAALAYQQKNASPWR